MTFYSNESKYEKMPTAFQSTWKYEYSSAYKAFSGKDARSRTLLFS